MRCICALCIVHGYEHGCQYIIFFFRIPKYFLRIFFFENIFLFLNRKFFEKKCQFFFSRYFVAGGFAPPHPHLGYTPGPCMLLDRGPQSEHVRVQRHFSKKPSRFFEKMYTFFSHFFFVLKCSETYAK